MLPIFHVGALCFGAKGGSVGISLDWNPSEHLSNKARALTRWMLSVKCCLIISAEVNEEKIDRTLQVAVELSIMTPALVSCYLTGGDTGSLLRRP
jgi:hypothetical protein